MEYEEFIKKMKAIYEALVVPDQSLINEYLKSKACSRSFLQIKFHYYYYLYPKMKKYLEEKVQKEISQIFNEDISIFEKSAKLVKMIHTFVH